MFLHIFMSNVSANTFHFLIPPLFPHPQAVRNNNGTPPADCSCDQSDDDCEMYTFNGTTFNVWEDVS